MLCQQINLSLLKLKNSSFRFLFLIKHTNSFHNFSCSLIYICRAEVITLSSGVTSIRHIYRLPSTAILAYSLIIQVYGRIDNFLTIIIRESTMKVAVLITDAEELEPVGHSLKASTQRIEI